MMEGDLAHQRENVCSLVKTLIVNPSPKGKVTGQKVEAPRLDDATATAWST
jgi:hypothetical protein